MRIKSWLILLVIFAATAGSALAADPKLDGAYKLVSIKTPNGTQTEANVKGMLVVHGKYMAFVRAATDRKTWEQSEPEADRMKKIVDAYQRLAATAGTFEVQGNTISLQQHTQANPGSMGTTVKWEYKLEGNKLTIKPVGVANVEFLFERMP